MSIARRFATVKWFFIVAWRHLNGRWYIYRDAPDWFVECMSDITEADPDHSDDSLAVVRAAKRERALRNQVKLRSEHANDR